jgi:small subunit ribosomal protein S21
MAKACRNSLAGARFASAAPVLAQNHQFRLEKAADSGFQKRKMPVREPFPALRRSWRATCLFVSAERVLPFMQIMVRENNVDQALRALKKKLQREGVYREMKLRRHYEKPSEKRAREKAAAVRRARKMDRKRAERDGTTR